MTRMLTFRCKVKKGIGQHSKLTIPGSNELPDAPSAWPKKLAPGSMNALIDDDGYPETFETLGSGAGMKKLDEGRFIPEYVIPQKQIENNTRGDAQVWRARICVIATGRELDCWALRRIGSGIKSQIELVSDIHLRTELKLDFGAEIIVQLFDKSFSN